MTRFSGPHLSPDEIDACLSGAAGPELQQHLQQCRECSEQLQAEREIVEQIAALPPLQPSEGFADRVMAAVRVPDPFSIRSFQATRRRLFTKPKSLIAAASLMLVLLGSMAGSIVWSLTNQDTLASIASWLLGQGGQAVWLGVQGLASNLIEQPWYAGLSSLVEHPVRYAVISALGSLAYLGGLLALRRLMAAPTEQVAHAGI
jgi:hypothetical protein